MNLILSLRIQETEPFLTFLTDWAEAISILSVAVFMVKFSLKGQAWIEHKVAFYYGVVASL